MRDGQARGALSEHPGLRKASRADAVVVVYRSGRCAPAITAIIAGVRFVGGGQQPVLCRQFRLALLVELADHARVPGAS